MGQKWPGNMARIPFLSNFRPMFHIFRAIFAPFPGEAKIQVSAIFSPISALWPEMDLYEVHGIATHFLYAISRFPDLAPAEYPRDPDILKTIRVVNLLLCSEFTTRSHSLQKNVANHYIFVLIYYILSSESLVVVNSLYRVVKHYGIGLRTKNRPGGSFG